MSILKSRIHSWDEKLNNYNILYPETDISMVKGFVETMHFLKRNTAYSKGDILRTPELLPGSYIVVTAAGITAGTEPNWDSVKSSINKEISDGTLKFVINNTSTLESHADYYNSISELKVSDAAVAGRICVTLGYYEANDNGGAIYLIREKANNDVDDGGSIIFLNNGKVAEFYTGTNLNVKQFGAKTGRSIACDDAFKNAIAYASKVGKTLYIPSGEYLLTKTLVIPTGTRIVGETSKMVFTGFSHPHLTFNFAADSMDAAIRIDDQETTSWNHSLDGNVSAVQLENLTFNGGDNIALCGLMLRGYRCVFKNLTFHKFCIGIWMSNSYLNDFDNIDIFNTQIGVIADSGTNSNTTIRNCWTQYNKDKNNDTVDSRIAKINGLYPTTSVGFFAFYGGMRLFDCYTEGVNIGVCVFRGTILIKHIGLELIGKTGACFLLKTDSKNLGKIVADNITEWGNYCPEVKASYGTICDLKFNFAKADKTTADNNIDNGAYVILDYTDGPGYILPISVKTDGALTNPTIEHNYSRFTRKGTIILDFVLNHEGFNSGKSIIITGMNANYKFDKAFFEVNGNTRCVDGKGDSMYLNNPETDKADNIKTGSRILAELHLTSSKDTLYYK